METIDKLQSIASHMHLEPAGESRTPAAQTVAPCGQLIRPDPPQRQKRKQEELGVYPAAVSGGKTIPLLKTMLTTACERDCYYCPFRAGRSYRRQTFKPEEMAKTFMDMHRAGLVKGLFLSSGIIKGGVTTQDKLIDTAHLLRHKHQFRGYVHLKVMPGVEKDQVYRAMQLADRLSVNLEAPNDHRLQLLAPKKQFVQELLRPLQWIEELRQAMAARHSWNGRWPSTVTQFVVGGVGESDLELLIISELLIKKLKLARTYYSAFHPISDTPMSHLPPENPLREHRLYQSSFLFRDYGFELEEMPFDSNGNLPLDEDPKRAWARLHLLEQPVEVNQAEPEQLLRLPGVGPKSMQQIVRARRQATLRELRDLQALGVATKNLEPYVLLDGKRPLRQLPLFATI